jgi:23S rRNA (cytidine1920-2'-O)/16S rRNA (cytidine1409-2'-O)-methyltransferase
MRLDDLLVQRGLAPSKSQAQAMILAGQVRTGTTILDKAGKAVRADLKLEVATPYRFVGRGAEKLEGYLEAFPLEVTDWKILDVGASTGGFTDCLLQRGAAEATCVDVGHGQLHYKLRQDPRVTNLERVNARHLTADQLPHPAYDLVVMDLSFISLKKVWPAVWPLLRPGGHLVALVKPQFEAGKAEVDAGRGVIRDDAVRERVLAEMRAFAASALPGSIEHGCCESPIHGADGNVEYLLGLKKVAS